MEKLERHPVCRTEKGTAPFPADANWYCATDLRVAAPGIIRGEPSPQETVTQNSICVRSYLISIVLTPHFLLCLRMPRTSSSKYVCSVAQFGPESLLLLCQNVCILYMGWHGQGMHGKALILGHSQQSVTRVRRQGQAAHTTSILQHTAGQLK